MLKDRIKQSRKNAGLTQQQLADRVGVKRGAVALWETGATKTLEAENLLTTAKTLNVNPFWLATGKGSSENDTLPPGITHDALKSLTPAQLNLITTIANSNIDDEYASLFHQFIQAHQK